MTRAPEAVRFRRAAPLLLAGVLAACQATSGEQTAASAPSEPSTTTTPATSEELTLGPGPFYLNNPRVGLEALASYTATLIATFEGTRDGQDYQWSRTHVMNHTDDPAASVVTVQSAGDLPAADPSFAAEAAGAAYDIGPAGACVGRAIDPEYSLVMWMDPTGLLDSVLGAEEAGQEVVDGVTAGHYTFDERAVGLSGMAEAAGEIWMAANGGYVLRYVRTITGTAEYFGEGIEGTLSWDYALTDINQPVDLPLPEDCQVEAPLLPDARNVLNLPNWLSFDSTSSIADAATFYGDGLTALGWTLVMASDPGETSAVLQFSAGDQEMFVIIAASDGIARVDILTRAAPSPES